MHIFELGSNVTNGSVELFLPVTITVTFIRKSEFKWNFWLG